MIIQGNALAIPLKDKSVECVVTTYEAFYLIAKSGIQQRAYLLVGKIPQGEVENGIGRYAF